MLLITVNNWWILMFFGVCYGSYTPVNYCRESETSPLCKVSEIVVEIKEMKLLVVVLFKFYYSFDFLKHL